MARAGLHVGFTAVKRLGTRVNTRMIYALPVTFFHMISIRERLEFTLFRVEKAKFNCTDEKTKIQDVGSRSTGFPLVSSSL